MKKNLGATAILAGLVIAGGFLLYFSWRSGEARRHFQYTPFEKAVPIPLIFDSLEGHAEKLGENQIKVNWRRKTVPSKAARPFLMCLGSFRPVDKTYYVLEMDGQLYLEKDEFVEPLIFALYNLYKGPNGPPPPPMIEDVITLLPNDSKILEELASKIKKH